MTFSITRILAGSESPCGKEINMSRNRLFNLIIAIALVIVLVFTVREAAATSIVTSEKEFVVRCHSLPSLYSIHSEYVEKAGIVVVQTEAGPTGADGGLIDLLSRYQSCLR
jgi:hypothetical protein